MWHGKTNVTRLILSNKETIFSNLKNHILYYTFKITTIYFLTTCDIKSVGMKKKRSEEGN